MQRKEWRTFKYIRRGIEVQVQMVFKPSKTYTKRNTNNLYFRITTLFMYFVIVIAVFCCLIPFAVGLLCYRNLSETSRIIFYSICLSVFSEVVSIYLAKVYHKNLLWLSIYQLLNFMIYLWFFYSTQKNYRNTIYLYFVISSSCITYWFVERMFIFGWNELGYFQIIISLIITALAIQLLLQELSIHQQTTTYTPLFYFALAMLIHQIMLGFIYTINLFLEDTSVQLKHAIWLINSVGFVVFYVLIAFGFYKSKILKQPRSY